MSPLLTREQGEIRDLAREFAVGDLRPDTERWDAKGKADPEVWSRLFELGFGGMLAPDDAGGLGLDVGTFLLAIEELAWGDPAAAHALSVHGGAAVSLLAEHGTPEQRARWLPRLCEGEVWGVVAWGSLTATVHAQDELVAVPVAEGGWTLRGTAAGVPNGARAGVLPTFARVEPGENVACFLLDPGEQTVRVERAAASMGFRASEPVELTFEDVRVEPDALLLPPAPVEAQATSALAIDRLGLCAVALGIARAALEHAVAYSREREQFGRLIGDFGAIRSKIAGMVARIESARALTYDVAVGLDARRKGTGMEDEARSTAARAATALISASETAMWVADEAVQIFGGYGYMRDYPVEKLMRDARGIGVLGGSGESLRALVAREIVAAAEGKQA